MTKTAKKVRKIYRKDKEDFHKLLQKEFLENWHKGYDSNLILQKLAKKHFKCYSRVCQIVKKESLVKGLTRSSEVIN